MMYQINGLGTDVPPWNFIPSNKLCIYTVHTTCLRSDSSLRRRKTPATSLCQSLSRIISWHLVCSSLSEVFWRMTSVLNQLMPPLLLCATTRRSYIDRLMRVDGTDTGDRVSRFKNDTTRWFLVRLLNDIPACILATDCIWISCCNYCMRHHWCLFDEQVNSNWSDKQATLTN